MKRKSSAMWIHPGGILPMADPTTEERMDNLLRNLHESSRLVIRTDSRRLSERISERQDSLREAILEYEKYLLTLDPATLSSILDLSEGVGNVLVTAPVEIDNEAFKYVGLFYRGSSMLCGPPETTNTDSLLRVPDGRYRFVLIAIPEGREDG